MQIKSNIIFTIILSYLVGLLFTQCKKDSLSPDKISLEFSRDTLSFDTLFVTFGSTTRFLTVKNPFNQTLEIGKIKLSEGGSSFFRINVDGVSGEEFENVVILPKDSIYIFVEVTVDPGAGNLPFLIEDAILFETGVKNQKVVLQAYGQNARFYNNEEIESETWTKDLPYVVLGGLLVKPGQTLTIQEGVTIYMGNNAAMYVQGNVKIEGTFEEPVTVRGVRLDNISSNINYDEIPGQWLGIFLLRNSKNNKINHVRIRNAQFGISMGSTTDIDNFNSISISDAPELFIQNSIIHNISVFGLYGVLSKIVAENLLIYDCGVHVLAVQAGGEYEFTHCTFNNQGSQFLNHKDPVLYASNYFVDPSKAIDVRKPLQFSATNSILYGTLIEELLVDSVNAVGYDFVLSNCLLKTRINPTSNLFNDCLFNISPQFEEEQERNYRLILESPAVNFGQTTTVLSDLENNLRDAQPDLGVYEYIP
jgi:hypothetical protein